MCSWRARVCLYLSLTVLLLRPRCLSFFLVFHNLFTLIITKCSESILVLRSAQLYSGDRWCERAATRQNVFPTAFCCCIHAAAERVRESLNQSITVISDTSVLPVKTKLRDFSPVRRLSINKGVTCVCVRVSLKHEYFCFCFVLRRRKRAFSVRTRDRVALYTSSFYNESIFRNLQK